MPKWFTASIEMGWNVFIFVLANVFRWVWVELSVAAAAALWFFPFGNVFHFPCCECQGWTVISLTLMIFVKAIQHHNNNCKDDRMHFQKYSCGQTHLNSKHLQNITDVHWQEYGDAIRITIQWNDTIHCNNICKTIYIFCSFVECAKLPRHAMSHRPLLSQDLIVLKESMADWLLPTISQTFKCNSKMNHHCECLHVNC